MSVSKKENRYNAYMKKTDSGVIVKTVDSVTGVESLIKFTSGSSLLSGRSLGIKPTEVRFKPAAKKSHEANLCISKKKKCHLTKRNSKYIPLSKINNLKPYLKELQASIPDFSVYKDNSNPKQDFQNPNVVFIANSKLAKDGVVNLNIPGKLGNVYYHGVMNESGIIKFKAKSVIKPITIIIGGYVINVNITHNLTTVKHVKNPKQINNQNSSHSEIFTVRNKNNKPTKENIFENKEAEIKAENHESLSDWESKFSFKTEPVNFALNGRFVESIPHVDQNEKETDSEFPIKFPMFKLPQLPYTHSQPSYTEENLDMYPSKENYHADEIRPKITPSVSLLVNQVDTSHKRSEHVVEEEVPDICSNSKIQQNEISYGRCKSNTSTRTLQTSVPDCYVILNGSKYYLMKETCLSNQSVENGTEINHLWGQNNLEIKWPTESENVIADIGKEEVKVKSLIKIKNKLSQATTSLQKISSVIESIGHVSEKSVSEDYQMAIKQAESAMTNNIAKGNSNENISDFFTTVIKHKSEEHSRVDENKHVGLLQINDEGIKNQEEIEDLSKLITLNTVKRQSGLKKSIYKIVRLEHCRIDEDKHVGIKQIDDKEIENQEEIEDLSSEFTIPNTVKKRRGLAKPLCGKRTYEKVNHLTPMRKDIGQKSSNKEKRTIKKSSSFDSLIYFAKKSSKNVEKSTPVAECIPKYPTRSRSCDLKKDERAKNLPISFSAEDIHRLSPIADCRGIYDIKYRYISISSIEREFCACMVCNEEVFRTKLEHCRQTLLTEINSNYANSMKSIFTRSESRSTEIFDYPVEGSIETIYSRNKKKSYDFDDKNKQSPPEEKSSKIGFRQKMKQKIKQLKKRLRK